MTYTLHVSHPVVGTIAPARWLDLHAEIEWQPDQQPRVVSAQIDCEESGTLTPHGANAFRCLSLAELIVARAFDQEPADPSPARLLQLEAQAARVRALMEDLAITIHCPRHAPL